MKSATDSLQNSMVRQMQTQGNMLNQMVGNLSKFGKQGFEVKKGMQVAQVAMDTPAAAMAAYRAMVGIPIVGPVLAKAAFAAAVATGLAQMNEIKKMQPPKLERGGLISGKSHSHGGVLIEAEGNEYITNKKRVGELGAQFFDFINFAPLEQVRKAFSSATPPPIVSARIASSNVANLENNAILSDILGGIKELKTAIEDKDLTVHNHISANEVGRNIDPEIIFQKNNMGRAITSNI